MPTALNQTLEQKKFLIEVVSSNQTAQHLLPPEEIHKFNEILKNFAKEDFSETVWIVKHPSEHIEKTLSFQNLNNIPLGELELIKAWTIGMLVSAFRLSTIKNKLNKINVFFKYLRKRNLKFTNIRNSIVSSFYETLPNDQLTICNDTMVAIQSLFDFAQMHDISFADNKIVFPITRVHKYPKARRAPDDCIVHALDLLFFNLSNDIPSDIRCLYMSLRLIPNRISEPLGMSIDCLEYPDEGVFSVLIPTMKETAYHRKKISKYPRSLNGKAEGLYHLALQMQKKYAYSAQNSLSEVLKDYLMVSTKDSTQLLSDVAFNKFLEELCKKEKIINANGAPATITSHELRHAAVKDRLASDKISPEQTMREANHNNLATTMSYGYASKHDEAQHTQKIVEPLQLELMSASTKELTFMMNSTEDCLTGALHSVRKLQEKKYKMLESSLGTRLLPGLGLCTDISCVPQFERCLDCEDFLVNPYYKDYFQECIYLMEERETKAKRSGNYTENSMKFNTDRIVIYRKFIDKLDKGEIYERA